jgi:aspartyl aminopeptidase
MEGLKNELFKFLDESTTAYHAVANIAAALDSEGYVRLYEDEAWSLECGKGYYVIRDGSSVIAFRNGGGSFMIGAAHSDSPAFRVKSVSGNSRYVRLSTEKYGGLINYTWLDRPLAISGRVTVK